MDKRRGVAHTYVPFSLKLSGTPEALGAFYYTVGADNYVYRALGPLVLCQARGGWRKCQGVCVEGRYGYFGYLVKYSL